MQLLMKAMFFLFFLLYRILQNLSLFFKAVDLAGANMLFSMSGGCNKHTASRLEDNSLRSLLLYLYDMKSLATNYNY